MLCFQKKKKERKSKRHKVNDSRTFHYIIAYHFIIFKTQMRILTCDIQISNGKIPKHIHCYDSVILLFYATESSKHNNMIVNNFREIRSLYYRSHISIETHSHAPY